MNIDLEYINDYFRNHWKPSLTAYNASAYEKIAEKIGDHEYLLDVGCGNNPFKLLVKNCYGIDPANDSADLQVSIEDFISQKKYDVVTCLGSINFGDETIISNQISKVVGCLKDHGRIYWRLNPGRTDHDSELCKKIPFFPWTFEKLKEFANIYEFKQTNEFIDKDENITRLYAEWHRI